MSTLRFTPSIIFGYVLVLTFVSAQTYYITPNASDSPCPGDSVPCLNLTEYNHTSGVTPPSSNSTSNMPCLSVPCMTLTEYPNQNLMYSPGSNVTLIFLPGTHHLGSHLWIQNVSNLILRVAPTKTSSPVVAIVTCTPSSGFIFEDIAGVLVSGLEFSGCEGNTVRSVDQLTIEDCMFQHGGCLNLAHIANGSVLRSSFNSLSGERRGGALYVGDSNITIHSSNFTNNTVTALLFQGHGGAILAVRTDLTIDSSNFTNNAVTGDGGAITSRHGDLTIDMSSFSNNTAGWGGAISSEGGNVTIDMSSFSHNTANYHGGAISSEGGCNATIDNSSFSHNTTDVGGGAISSGILISSSDNYTNVITIDMSSFSHNTANYGGAIFSEGGCNVTIDMSSFSHNTANYGGAISLDGASGCNVTIDMSSFSYNTADLAGGAVYMSVSTTRFSQYTEDWSISSTKFIGNRAVASDATWQGDGGAVMIDGHFGNSDDTISNCTFINNTAGWWGGAISSMGAGCNVTIDNSSFSHNTANYGGAISSEGGNVTIDMSSFSHNTANYHGGAISSEGGCNATIDNSSFSHNTADVGGGAIISGNLISSSDNYTNVITIDMSSFSHNTANHGGAISLDGASGCNVTIDMSSFSYNTADLAGGAVYMSVSTTRFSQYTEDWSISSTKFIGNRAVASDATQGDGGAVMIDGHFDNSDDTISNCTFINNTAERSGGALSVENSDRVAIRDNTFSSNTAGEQGGAIHVQSSILTSTGFLHITNNTAMIGVVYGLGSELTFSGNITISNNYGSVYAFSSNVTFTGYTNIRNNSPISRNQEGGAVTSFQSDIVFTGTVELMYNQVNNGSGGAILAIESKIYSYGDTTIANNTALSGGGIYAYQSELSFNDGTAIIRNNTADMRGGGIYAVSTTTKLSGGMLQFIENRAERGGGMCLELNAKIYVIKAEAECSSFNWPNCTTNFQNPGGWLRSEFISNSADYGGALYVSDGTNSGTCSANTDQSTSSECFFQALALHSSHGDDLHTLNTYFDGNSATISGATIFGGLLDRCTVSPYAEVFKQYNPHLSLKATSYLFHITNLQTSDIQTEMSSKPVRVCFCKNDQPDCNDHPTPIYQVEKGQAFNVLLVTVDQVNNPVSSTVRASLSSHDGGLGDGQEIQNTTSNCTELKYTVTSPHNSEQLVLYADGPCKDIGISQTQVEVQFLPCDCPIGFEKSEQQSNCICDCDPKVTEYITSCSFASESIQRKDNIWITYINTTEQEGFVKYTHCPFDYCKPSTDQVWINLNVPNGADAQCDFNRSGKLCGSCEDGLSLSLGSSRCMSCSNNWLALLIVFAIAGVALVAFLLVCNLTVAVGTINGLIFYANILVTNRATFFPFETPNFFTVFIAWINLDFGFVICFFDGMDGYSKTWLQLAFPTYIIFLVAMVIKISDHSVKFSKLFSKYNTIPTLATLVLLSYTKFLRTIISAWQFATMEYPDGSRQRLWLVDANVRYLELKHAFLFIAALLVLLIGLILTLLLFLWQWLQYGYEFRVMWWIRSAKLFSFIDAYHNPYTARHRYWTGLLLLARILLYLVSTVSGAVTNDPRVNLLTIICVVGSLLMWKEVMKEKVYKKWSMNVLDTSFLFNLIIFSAGTYHIRETGGNQAALAYTSTSIAFITFLAILVYHTYAFVIQNPLNKLKTLLVSNANSTQPHNPEPPEERSQLYSDVIGDADTVTVIEMPTLGADTDSNDLETDQDTETYDTCTSSSRNMATRDLSTNNVHTPLLYEEDTKDSEHEPEQCYEEEITTPLLQ